MARPIPLAAPVTTATWPSIERLSWVRRGMGRDRSGPTGAVEPWCGPVGRGRGAGARRLVAARSRWRSAIWALLDAARRPQWAWALAERRQVVWMAAIMFGTLTVIGGVVLCAWYLTRVRHEVAAAEEGQI